MASLRGLCTAQEEFRRVDADRNGVQDYWRGDVAGLYTLAPGGTPLRYIELSTALADRRPLSALPQQACTHYGYWYQTLGFADERRPDPSRFAYLAVPETTGHEAWMFIVNHEGVPYGKRTESAKPPDVYPDNPRSEGWLTWEQIRAVRWRRGHTLWWVQFWRAF
jgi:hypothetical protein